MLLRHLKREGEPVDNPVWSGDKPSLHQASYKYLAQKVDTEVMKIKWYFGLIKLNNFLIKEYNKISETHEAQKNVFIHKPDHVVKEHKDSMVDYKNAQSVLNNLLRF